MEIRIFSQIKGFSGVLQGKAPGEWLEVTGDVAEEDDLGKLAHALWWASAMGQTVRIELTPGQGKGE
jgi:hypothetical protein